MLKQANKWFNRNLKSMALIGAGVGAMGLYKTSEHIEQQHKDAVVVSISEKLARDALSAKAVHTLSGVYMDPSAAEVSSAIHKVHLGFENMAALQNFADQVNDVTREGRFETMLSDTLTIAKGATRDSDKISVAVDLDDLASVAKNLAGVSSRTAIRDLNAAQIASLNLDNAAQAGAGKNAAKYEIAALK